MELTDLRHFFHVAVTGSFAKGARLSHVSPPAVSKAVKKLEDELGARLFDRTTRSVRLTIAGEALRVRCERIFAELEALRGDLAGDTPRGRLRIGANEVLSIELLPRAIVRLIRRHPDVVPHVYEMIPQRMERALAEGEIDLGLTIGARHAPGIEAIELGRSPGVLVCGRGHPLHRARRVRAADLRAHRSVVPSFFGQEHLPPLDQFPDARWPREIGATIELLQMAVRLVEEGAFLGYFPEISVRAQLEDGRFRSLAGLPAREPFHLTALVRSPVRSAARVLIDELRALVRSATRRR